MLLVLTIHIIGVYYHYKAYVQKNMAEENECVGVLVSIINYARHHR